MFREYFPKAFHSTTAPRWHSKWKFKLLKRRKIKTEKKDAILMATTVKTIDSKKLILTDMNRQVKGL